MLKIYKKTSPGSSARCDFCKAKAQQDSKLRLYPAGMTIK